ncbi:MAG: hypothetical protein ACRDZ6_00725 [Acidimicrobiales bacterium]
MDAATRAVLLGLIDDATASGWSNASACRELELAEVRAYRWMGRRAAGELEDHPSGVHPMHGLLDDEVQAIIALYHDWGDIDRSHRKLAHRGSYTNTVFVGPSSVRRVLAVHGLVLHPPKRPGTSVRNDGHLSLSAGSWGGLLKSLAAEYVRNRHPRPPSKGESRRGRATGSTPWKTTLPATHVAKKPHSPSLLRSDQWRGSCERRQRRPCSGMRTWSGVDGGWHPFRCKILWYAPQAYIHAKSSRPDSAPRESTLAR